MTKNEIDQFPELEDEELIPEVLFLENLTK